jgi:hypothetical protein
LPERQRQISVAWHHKRDHFRTFAVISALCLSALSNSSQALLTFQDTGCPAEVLVANPQKTALNFRLATCDNTSKHFN